MPENSESQQKKVNLIKQQRPRSEGIPGEKAKAPESSEMRSEPEVTPEKKKVVVIKKKALPLKKHLARVVAHHLDTPAQGEGEPHTVEPVLDSSQQSIDNKIADKKELPPMPAQPTGTVPQDRPKPPYTPPRPPAAYSSDRPGGPGRPPLPPINRTGYRNDYSQNRGPPRATDSRPYSGGYQPSSPPRPGQPRPGGYSPPPGRPPYSGPPRPFQPGQSRPPYSGPGRPPSGPPGRPFSGQSPQGGRPYQGGFGSRPYQGGMRPGPGGGRPGGGYGGRSSPLPVQPLGRGAAKKPASKRKVIFSKKEQEAEKAIQIKKKAEAQALAIPKEIYIMESISIAELARKMNLKSADIIAKLMAMGMMATINQKIDSVTATLLAEEYGTTVKVVSIYDETVIAKADDKIEDLMPRAPIVTVMGHVDHGKTKLLDAIRKTDVAAGEFGGITQHIGAYQVHTSKGPITFLDTPGHAAFTKMRARGAGVTDIAVLVVAANDGVMPQTREAIDHARAANVPIIVAINKIDLPDANPDRVKTQLSDLGLQPEEWGGTTIFCAISALKKEGIAELLDAVLLQAEVLELKANFSRFAEATIIESKIDQGRGIVGTVIIKRGTLKIGDSFVAGIFSGKVRAMFNDKLDRITEALPSMPVEVIGFEGMPNAGDPFEVVVDEKQARAVSMRRQELKKYEEGRNVKKVTLDNLYSTIQNSDIQELRVLIKADVQGSAEALKGLLEKLTTTEIKLVVVRAAAGAITEDDVMLASTSDAIVIAFNVRPTSNAKAIADRERVDIRKYNVIYHAEEEIRKAMEGLLTPEIQAKEMGKVEVRQIFKVPKIGVIAGCFVTEGIVRRNCLLRVIRNEIEIYQGKISSLKRFKDDAKEVGENFECGVSIENYNDLKVGDILEAYENIEVMRTLSESNSAAEVASRVE